MIVLICATGVEKTMPLYLRQLQAGGVDVEWGFPAGQIGHNVGSWKGKILWQREALSRFDPDESVILTDGWDVVFQGDKVEVEAKLPPRDRILISGEKNCWPDWHLQSRYPMGPTPWMFVNSGCIAGTAGLLLREMERGLAEARPELVDDDQRFWTWLFLTGNQIDIDYQCSLFQTMFLQIVGSDLGVKPEPRRLWNVRTGTSPNFLHWNGGETWPTATLRLLGMEEA